MDRRADTRERIVEAAIACMEREGVEGTTIRRIAREAGVNVAAISYYFGSKEALLAAAFDRTLDTGFDLSELDEMVAGGLGLRAAAEAFVLDYLTRMQSYPRIAEAHLHGPLTGAPFPPALAQRIDGFVRGFAERMAPLQDGSSAGGRLRAAAQLWSAVLFPGLLPGFFRSAGVDVRVEAERTAYVRELIERYLGREETGGGA